MSETRKPSDARKQSIYFPDEMLEELNAMAIRLDRSRSWVVQMAWKFAREEMAKFPGARDFEPQQVPR